MNKTALIMFFCLMATLISGPVNSAFANTVTILASAFGISIYLIKIA